MPYSPEERQRRSERAKELHRRGVLGGPEGGRKAAETRTRRASELSAKLVEKHEAKIEGALVAGLKSSKTSERLKAAELALKMGLSGERNAVAEQKTVGQERSRDELISAIVSKFDSPAGALIRQRLAEGSIDSTAVEVE